MNIYKIMRWSTNGYIDTDIRCLGEKRAEKMVRKLSKENNSNLFCKMKVEGIEKARLNLIFAEEWRVRYEIG